MNVPFDNNEIAAINQLSQLMDLPPERVVIQAIRLFQLYRLGRIQIIFPTILDVSPIVDVDEPVKTVQVLFEGNDTNV